MSKFIRNVAGPFAVLFAVGFVVFLTIASQSSEMSMTRLFFGDGTFQLLRVLVYGIPLGLLLTLAFLSFRSAVLRRRARPGDERMLDISTLTQQRVTDAAEEVDAKRTALRTHRFTCPRCGGNASYIENTFPLHCDVDDRHSWATPRDFVDELMNVGRDDDAARFARLLS